MEKSSKRGKIPQQDWPSIISRYEAGETLASIARTYDCSPPAISYIVSRTRARSAVGDSSTAQPVEAPGSGEPQLVKGAIAAADAKDMPDNDLTHTGAPAAAAELPPSETAPTPAAAAAPKSNELKSNESSLPLDSRPLPVSVAASPSRHGQGATQPNGRDPREDEGRFGAAGGMPRPVAGPVAPSSNSQPNGEGRRTLHLSLPQANAPGNVNSPNHPQPGPPAPGNLGFGGDNRHGTENRAPARVPGGNPGFAPPARQSGASASLAGPPANQFGGHGPAPPAEPSPKARDSGVFIDQALRDRINSDIAAFLSAFDAALADDTAESRAGLREATDRLLRAGARTRIELERLEARVPLSSRETGPRPLPVFRSR
jgi:hypothetical protein